MKFKMPETLEGLTRDEINALIDGALDDFRALSLTEEGASEDDIAAGETLIAHLNTLRTQLAKVEADEAEAEAQAQAEAQARADRIAALNEAAGVAPEAVEPPADEAPAEDSPAGEPADVAPAAPAEPAAAPEPVLAAGTPPPAPTRSPVQRAAASAPEVHVPTENSRTVSLVAAADVPGYANGQELDDLGMVTAAVLARTRGLPKTNLATAAGGVRQRYGAALIQKQGFGDLTQKRDGTGDLELVWKAGDEARLPGGSLVAAGGWCAPSETLYDLCQYETVEGILSIPEFQVTRGGIRWTPGPAFEDIYTACGFEQTEAQAIAGECKDCCTVDCPVFDEVRLDAIGICIKSPLLTEHAYPELVRRFIEGAMVAHEHKVNKYILDTMTLAAGTPVEAVQAGSLAITLATIELTAVGLRYKYRLSQTAALEVVLPFWAKTQLRMDLGLRNDRQAGEVSDAEVNAWFSARNLSPQFVYDFQDPTFAGVGGNDVILPAEFTVLMYPAGTWARGSADVINVDAVYDSPNLEANQYTALFIEEGILAVQRCTHTVAVTIPVCVSGKGVLDDIDVCLTAPLEPVGP